MPFGILDGTARDAWVGAGRDDGMAALIEPKDAAEVPSDVERLDKETAKSTGNVAKPDGIEPAAPPLTPAEAAKQVNNFI